MSYARICDRSDDGEFCQIQCEACGVPMDWVSNVELTMMAIVDLHHYCFDCDISSDHVHLSLLIGNDAPDIYLVEMPDGEVEIRVV